MGNYESDKRNCRIFTFKFTRNNDQDIINRLESVQNKQAYVKSLIRADIAANKTPKNHFEKECSHDR